jgi:Na+/melibiose symporter-like transporter
MAKLTTQKFSKAQIQGFKLVGAGAALFLTGFPILLASTIVDDQFDDVLMVSGFVLLIVTIVLSVSGSIKLGQESL